MQRLLTIKHQQRVARLLTGRLRRAGAKSSRPDWYFQCEPAPPPEAYSGGWQVRVRTWRYWSDAAVHLDGQSGELMYRCVDRLSDPPTQASLTREQAEQLAASAVQIPRDARLKSVQDEPFSKDRTLTRLEWSHVVGGLPVEGDYLRVLLHPQTGRAVSIARRWRPVNIKVP